MTQTTRNAENALSSKESINFSMAETDDERADHFSLVRTLTQKRAAKVSVYPRMWKKNASLSNATNDGIKLIDDLFNCRKYYVFQRE